MTPKPSDFFYCYDSLLFNYLKNVKGISFICSGINQKTNKKFYQFFKTEELHNSIQEYLKLNK